MFCFVDVPQPEATALQSVQACAGRLGAADFSPAHPSLSIVRGLVWWYAGWWGILLKVLKCFTWNRWWCRGWGGAVSCVYACSIGHWPPASLAGWRGLDVLLRGRASARGYGSSIRPSLRRQARSRGFQPRLHPLWCDLRACNEVIVPGWTGLFLMWRSTPRSQRQRWSGCCRGG